MNETEIAWLAGILEGEGSFILQLNKPNSERHRHGWTTACIHLAMTDRDVVDRAAQICGRPELVRPEKRIDGLKQSWRLQLTKQSDVRRVLEAVRPWMLARRQEKVDELLAHLDLRASMPSQSANGRKTHCPRRHRYDEANTRVNADGSRTCRVCDRERERSR